MRPAVHGDPRYIFARLARALRNGALTIIESSALVRYRVDVERMAARSRHRQYAFLTTQSRNLSFNVSLATFHAACIMVLVHLTASRSFPKNIVATTTGGAEEALGGDKSQQRPCGTHLAVIVVL